MTHKVLIDYNRRGWAEEMDTKIRSDYKEILKVGVGRTFYTEISKEALAKYSIY